MNNQNKDSKAYWSEFSPIWWEEIKSWFGWEDSTKTIIRSGTHLLALLVIFWVGGNIQKLIEAIEVQIAEGSIILLSLYSILFVTYNRASRKLYGQQEAIQAKKDGEIKELRDKYESSPRFNPLVITPFNDIESKKRVGIRIDNSMTQSVSNIRVELSELIYIPLGTKRTHSQLRDISPSNRRFAEGDRFNQNKGIDGLDHIFVYLAKEVDRKIVLLLEESQENVNLYDEIDEDEANVEHARKIQPRYTGWKQWFSIFEIEVTIRGEANNIPLKLKSFRGRIIFSELISHWRFSNNNWAQIGDLPEIYTEIKIEEIEHENEENKDKPLVE